MIHVTVAFHEDLHFFLSDESRRGDIEASFHVTRSVKDLIESLGVPHVEVDCILVNGASAGFDYLLDENDRITVFPPGLSARSFGCKESELLRLSPPDQENTRFLADVHLKTLARLLRMLGFDTLYDRRWDDHDLARIAVQEDRVLLSRDTRLLMRSTVSRGFYVRSTNPDEQIVEAVIRYHLAGRFDPFKRCINCNGEITQIDKERIAAGEVPPGVKAGASSIFRCRACGKYYWNGSHVERMRERIETIRRQIR